MIVEWEREAQEKVLLTSQRIEEEYGKLAAADFLEEITHVVNLLEQMIQNWLRMEKGEDIINIKPLD